MVCSMTASRLMAMSRAAVSSQAEIASLAMNVSVFPAYAMSTLIGTISLMAGDGLVRS